MKRDSKRSAVYASEWNALEQHLSNRRIREIADVVAFVNEITQSKWYKNYKIMGKEHSSFCRRTKPHIDVGDGRGRRRACGGGTTIKLPKWCRKTYVILHELAHTMQFEQPWHGRQFAAIYLDLVRRWMGRNAWEKLRDEFRKHKVWYSARRNV